MILFIDICIRLLIVMWIYYPVQLDYGVRETNIAITLDELVKILLEIFLRHLHRKHC